MSEIRRDPLAARRIIVAPHRAGRPNEYASRDGVALPRAQCPFCPGNEAQTPPEVAADREPGSRANDPRWTLRVIPNRYPAFVADGADAPGGQASSASGAHEVVIESRDHDARLEMLPAPEAIRYFLHLRDRARHHAARGAGSVLVFRNRGPNSGASLAHPHTQLVALDAETTAGARERGALAAHFAATGRCAICDLVAAERAGGARVVAEHSGLVAFVPHAARFGAETWIAPAEHPPRFTELDDGRIAALARFVQEVAAAMGDAFSNPSWNLILAAHQADPMPGATPHYRIELLPRLAQIGGFELATGDFIVSRAPEASAARLRERFA
jgi:UDPglucose--hexose-1-phosphate uridylyltransferase